MSDVTVRTVTLAEQATIYVFVSRTGPTFWAATYSFPTMNDANRHAQEHARAFDAWAYHRDRRPTGESARGGGVK